VNAHSETPGQHLCVSFGTAQAGWVPFKNLAVSQDIPGWIGA
jgi:hypothetical protein